MLVRRVLQRNEHCGTLDFSLRQRPPRCLSTGEWAGRMWDVLAAGTSDCGTSIQSCPWTVVRPYSGLLRLWTVHVIGFLNYIQLYTKGFLDYGIYVQWDLGTVKCPYNKCLKLWYSHTIASSTIQRHHESLREDGIL